MMKRKKSSFKYTLQYMDKVSRNLTRYDSIFLRKYFNNNYRKLHGLPMKRRVHIRKLHVWCKPDFVGIDIGDGHDWYHLLTNMRSDYDIPVNTYGQKVINQNAVYKIVMSGEENGDE